MTSLHLHHPHVPYSYYLMGLILGILVLPPVILRILFAITKHFAGER